jgi:hypothetical protein
MADEKSSTLRSCSVPGCDRTHVARGLCKPHYREARANGLPLAEPVRYAPICSVDGCGNQQEKRGYCDKHYRRIQRKGTIETVRQPPGGLVRMAGGYVTRRVDGEKKLEHVRIAERALGKPMPVGAEVHHVNEQTSDNRPENLVICPDREYHMLLHARQRAQDACGNANWRHCCYCKQYDDPSNMSARATRGKLLNSFWHKACAAEYQRKRKQS